MLLGKLDAAFQDKRIPLLYELVRKMRHEDVKLYTLTTTISGDSSYAALWYVALGESWETNCLCYILGNIGSKVVVSSLNPLVKCIKMRSNRNNVFHTITSNTGSIACQFS